MYSRKTKIIIFVIILIATIIDVCSGVEDVKMGKEYKHINVGKGHMRLVSDALEDAQIDNKDGYCVITGDDYFIIGIDFSVEDVENGANTYILKEWGDGISSITRLKDLEAEKELPQIFNVKEENILILSSVNRPSYEKYLMIYDEADEIFTVSVYKGKKGCLVQLIKSKKDYFSIKQLRHLFDGLWY